MRVYDPLPDFNCNDPTPFKIPRRPISFWRRAIVVFGWSILAGGLIGSFFVLAAEAILMWLSS